MPPKAESVSNEIATRIASTTRLIVVGCSRLAWLGPTGLLGHDDLVHPQHCQRHLQIVDDDESASISSRQRVGAHL
jgi:hypothetical protein